MDNVETAGSLVPDRHAALLCEAGFPLKHHWWWWGGRSMDLCIHNSECGNEHLMWSGPQRTYQTVLSCPSVRACMCGSLPPYAVLHSILSCLPVLCSSPSLPASLCCAPCIPPCSPMLCSSPSCPASLCCAPLKLFLWYKPQILQEAYHFRCFLCKPGLMHCIGLQMTVPTTPYMSLWKAGGFEVYGVLQVSLLCSQASP